jgi:hypothetical protein
LPDFSSSVIFVERFYFLSLIAKTSAALAVGNPAGEARGETANKIK